MRRVAVSARIIYPVPPLEWRQWPARPPSLKPMPPVASKQKDVRYFHVHEHDEIDEAQLDDWVKRASALPGEKM